MRRLVLLFVVSSFCVFGVGCATAPVRLDNAARLMARPDFSAAAQACPAWAAEALHTINRLEFQLERK